MAPVWAETNSQSWHEPWHTGWSWRDTKWDTPKKQSLPGDSSRDFFIPYLEVTTNHWFRVTFSLTIPKKVTKNHLVLKTRGNLFDLISHEAHKQLHVESSSTRNGMILGAGNQSQKVPLSPSRKKGNNLDLEVFLSNPPKSNFWYKVFGVFLKLCD